MGVDYGVVVVGGGNAGFSAAHAAIEQGTSVLLLERAGEANAGGNSFYTAGAFRFAIDSLDDVVDLFDDETTSERLPDSVVPAYPETDFRNDMERVTEGRCDPILTDVLVSSSADTVRWLAGKGIKWRLMYERQSYLSEGKWVFSGGLYVGTVGGGKGLIAQHTETARREGVDVRYGADVTGLDWSDGLTVTYRCDDGERVIRAGALVLAAGGFESSPERREKYLGAGWGEAMVRGCPTNTGDVLDLALAAGAVPHGDWTTCHSTAWDAGAPPQGGNRELTNQLTRQSYPIGIVVNVAGERFVDEGADFRNYTYAKYGREILRQTGGRAFQLFDATTRPLLRKEEYDSEPITNAVADTLPELASRLGIDADGLVRTVTAFNDSIVDKPFDPAVKDGRAAQVTPPKSNWAMALETPPYYGYAVGCGVTFTFGGLHVDKTANVRSENGDTIHRVYAAGEMVGGLFSGNYPGGSGLTSGAVFGRLAGENAARIARDS